MTGIALRQPVASGWITRRRPPAIRPLLSQGVILWIGASLLLVAAALNFYLFQVSIVATSAYDLQRLQQERQDWLSRNQQLELELAKARSLAWVRYKAIQDLHMVQGGEPVYLHRTPHVAAPVLTQATFERAIEASVEPSVDAEDSSGLEEAADEPREVAPQTPASRASPLPFPNIVITILLGALRG
jgi:hypothetical protein